MTFEKENLTQYFSLDVNNWIVSKNTYLFIFQYNFYLLDHKQYCIPFIIIHPVTTFYLLLTHSLFLALQQRYSQSTYKYIHAHARLAIECQTVTNTAMTSVMKYKKTWQTSKYFLNTLPNIQPFQRSQKLDWNNGDI